MKSKRDSKRSGADDIRAHPEFERELRKFAKRDPVGAERMIKGIRRFFETGLGDVRMVEDEPLLSRLKVALKLPRVFLARKGGVTYLLGLERRKVAYASRVLERMDTRAKDVGAHR